MAEGLLLVPRGAFLNPSIRHISFSLLGRHKIKAMSGAFSHASPVLALQAQEKLLSWYLKRCSFEVRSSPSSGINYVIITNKEKAMTRYNNKPRTLVLMHGYGSGLGMFNANFDTLAEHYDQIIAADWLGMGSSSRTHRRVTSATLYDRLVSAACTGTERELTIAQTVIDDFVDSLHDLIQEEDLSEFTLAGHSLGGYLVGHYALKYPKKVNSLILISPVGIPLTPSEATRVKGSELDWRIRLIGELWKLNITPQLIVRMAGRRGYNMLLNAVDRRFDNRWTGEESRIVTDYIYQITALPGNGEYCLNALLEPVFTKRDIPDARTGRTSRAGVYAKIPLEEKLSKLSIPILMLFGDNDWLSFPQAQQVADKWQQAELLVIPKAGHHLYLDNSSVFNQGIVNWSTRSLVKM